MFELFLLGEVVGSYFDLRESSNYIRAICLNTSRDWLSSA